MLDGLLDDIDNKFLCLLLIKGREDIDRLRRPEQPRYMLIHVDDAILLEVQHIEHSVCPCGSPLIDGDEHVLLICDDLVEVGIVVAVVPELSVAVGRLEVVEDLGLFCDLQHGERKGGKGE
jgi:hypothetical protein